MSSGLFQILGTYFLLGGILSITGGFYNGPSILLLVSLVALGGWRFTGSRSRGSSEPVLVLSLCAVSACFGVWAIVYSRPIFTLPGPGLNALQTFLDLSVAGTLLLCVPVVVGIRRSWIPAIAVCCALAALAARASVILASPHPVIDVYSLTTQAARFLLSGANPYHQVYGDVYHQGVSDRAQIFQYPPGYLLWASAFVRVFGDLRWGHVFSEAATAVALFKIVRAQTGSKEMPWVFPVAWLSFPVGCFVIEQAWVDPFIVALTAWLAWALLRQRLFAAGLLVGILLVSKQYCLFVGIVTAAWIYAHHRTRWKTFAAGVFGSALGIMTPFVVSDWRGLYHATIEEVLATPTRADAMTLRALALNRWGLSIPAWPSLALDAAAVTVVWWRVTTSRINGLQDWAAGLALLYLVVFISGPQAFCNYYFLDAFFVLLWLAFHAAASDARTDSVHEVRVARQ